jgi:DNA polymerase III subunit gamma/tau
MAEEKQHQALYRRYRPQTPAEVIGQDHVVRALTGSIREDRLHHAFLFCGPRGTGKTSTARILAKMVNCEQGPTVEPCGTCRQCVAIRDGNHLDVVEIDAASHGGVEDARELRERAPTAPAMGREKVYIIDEAQRLTGPAFDALLKLFEEPPPGVRFVLATTEPQKMPATIVGRCQRFDFRRLTMEDLAKHLQTVAASEGTTLTDPAAHAIARAAEGSARDALSILDQASVLGGDAIDDEAVTTLLGAPRGEVQYELADAVAVGDAHATFQLVDRLVADGRDLRTVTSEALAHFRNLLIAKTAPGQEDLLDVPPDAYERLRIQAEKFSPGELARVLSLLLAAQNDMRWTTSPRISLELALVRSSIPDTDPNPAGLVARMERLERLADLGPTSVMPSSAASAVSAAPAVSAASAAPASPPTAERRPSDDVMVPPAEATPEPEGAEGSSVASEVPPHSSPVEDREAPAGSGTQLRTGHPHAASADSVDASMLRRSWPTFLEHLSDGRKPVLAAALASATVASYDGTSLELVFPPALAKVGPQRVEQKQDELQEALNELFGIRPTITSVVRETREPSAGAPAVELIDEDEVPDDEEALRRVQEMLGAQPVEPGAE